MNIPYYMVKENYLFKTLIILQLLNMVDLLTLLKLLLVIVILYLMDIANLSVHNFHHLEMNHYYLKIYLHFVLLKEKLENFNIKIK